MSLAGALLVNFEFLFHSFHQLAPSKAMHSSVPSAFRRHRTIESALVDIPSHVLPESVRQSMGRTLLICLCCS